MAQPTIVQLPPEEEKQEPEISSSSALSEEERNTVANLSSPWEYDENAERCSQCSSQFNVVNRKHHCRFCGKIFCGDCTNQRCLIPPTSIVLVPKGGKKAKAREEDEVSFNPDQDPDRMLTYVNEEEKVLYGKGLEERFKLAREPLRVCGQCFIQLQPLQPELRHSNSNAMRYNHIDPTDPKRFMNSPLAFTLGHEVRKAAYTLNNLLPLPRRIGALQPTSANYDGHSDFNVQQCKDTCSSISPSLGDLDGVRIPARLMQEAKGVATMTVVKGGFGLVGLEIGTGLVVAKNENGTWSAPSAIGTGGLSWGALVGAQVSDHVFLLMNDSAVEMLFSNNGSINLGADIGVSLGPLGRSLEGNVGASQSSVAPIYTYSLSKGLYAGVSLDGKVIVTRHDVNEKFYGRQVSAHELLTGAVPTPPAAQPLYDALTRCQVYGGNHSRQAQPRNQQLPTVPEFNMEFGEFVPPGVLPIPTPSIPANHESMLKPPATNDQHSYVSDITSDPGY